MNQLVSGIFNVISAVLVLYMVIILVRVLSSWFSAGVTPGFMGILNRITDPFLNIFKGMKFLRFQYLDLSPLAAIIVLQIAIMICSRIANERSLWFGLVLSVFIELVGGAISFFFIFFFILAAIRLIGIFTRASSVQQLWFTLDHILQPLVYPIITRLSPRKVLPYGTGLGIFMGLNVAAWFLCNFLFTQLTWLARSIPF